MDRLGDDQAVTRLVNERMGAASAREARRIERRIAQPPSLFRWLPLLLALVAMMGLVELGMAAIDNLTGPQIAEACEGHGDCGAGEFCMKHLALEARYCSRPCDAPESCPAGMHCGNPATIPDAERSVGVAGAGAASSACIR